MDTQSPVLALRLAERAKHYSALSIQYAEQAEILLDVGALQDSIFAASRAKAMLMCADEMMTLAREFAR